MSIFQIPIRATRRIGRVVFIGAALTMGGTAMVDRVAADLPCLDQTGCVDCCPTCGYYCKLSAECVDDDKDGFDVESEVICIPRVVFPWQKRTGCHCGRIVCNSCNHNGARKRRVCKLTRDSITCPKCKYSWKAKKCGEDAEKSKSKSEPMVAPTPAPQVQNSSPGTPASTLFEAPYEDLTNPYPPGFEEATTFPQPLDNDGLPDSGIFNSPNTGTPGMEEALKFPTPIRPGYNP